MNELLRNAIVKTYNEPVNTPKDCELLAEIIYKTTARQISSTTLRRFLGLLPSKTLLSRYNLDTLAIYCGAIDYADFCAQNDEKGNGKTGGTNKLSKQFLKLSLHTTNSILKKSLTKFDKTIPREGLNLRLNEFLVSTYTIYPLIAPGGYGKSIALAHWAGEIDTTKYECLFCTASIFYQLLKNKTGQTQAVNSSIGQHSNYSDLLGMHDGNKGKTKLFIIDALDKISPYADKYNELVAFLYVSAENFGNNGGGKIVFSVRESTWSNLMRSDIDLVQLKSAIYPVENNPSAGYSNLDPFSNAELKSILKIHNQDLKNPIVLSSISILVQELIRTPINLHYYIAMAEKGSDFNLINSVSLIREYLKEYVFMAKHAEFKEDIVWKVVELTGGANFGFSIDKNQLKDYYPIHLKRETGYYQAYRELISGGILYEEREEGKYGIYTSQIGFKHQNFYYYLSALNQIRKNRGLNFKLVEWVSTCNYNFEWICNLVAIFYEISYEDEIYATLEDFCSLDEDILASVPVRYAVGQSFRIKNGIRDKVVQGFAADAKGQTYFFEEFNDTNYLFNNFEYRIHQYLKHKYTSEALLYGNSILFLARFLKMDVEMCNTYFELIKNNIPTIGIHPWPIARRLSYMILYTCFIEGKMLGNTGDQIRKNRLMAYQYEGYLEFGLVEFELPILVMLTFTREYQLIIEIAEHAMESYHFDKPKDQYFNTFSANWNKLPYLFMEYAKYKTGLDVEAEYPDILEKAIDEFVSTFDDFQYKILLEFFLADYYAGNDKTEKAYEFYDSAMELSKYAEYDFFTAWLLVNNPFHDAEKIKRGQEMITKTGFFKDAFFEER